jgi:hypothetical protein
MLRDVPLSPSLRTEVILDVGGEVARFMFIHDEEIDAVCECEGKMHVHSRFFVFLYGRDNGVTFSPLLQIFIIEAKNQLGTLLSLSLYLLSSR